MILQLKHYKQCGPGWSATELGISPGSALVVKSYIKYTTMSFFFLVKLQSLVFCWILYEYFYKQCGPGLSAAERGISSGSSLGVISVLSVQGTCYDDS